MVTEQCPTSSIAGSAKTTQALAPGSWNGILTRMVRAEVLDLEVVEKRVLKLFTVTSEHYVLPNGTSGTKALK